MTEEDYYATVRLFGLTRTQVPTVFVDADGLTYHVPDASSLPPEVRAGVIRRLREALGIGRLH